MSAIGAEPTPGISPLGVGSTVRPTTVQLVATLNYDIDKSPATASMKLQRMDQPNVQLPLDSYVKMSVI